MSKNLTKSDKKLSMKQVKFIKAFVEVFGHVTKACEKTGISRETYYEWIKSDAFKEAIAERIIQRNDQILHSAIVQFSAAVMRGDKWAVSKAIDMLGGQEGFKQISEVNVKAEPVVLTLEESGFVDDREVVNE
ncbi:MAG: hypothetical protein PHQ75_00515 [Thermoguttaceae bacterium]|nr:hypothetical protein [Thermoguttaceae bacterium]